MRAPFNRRVELIRVARPNGNDETKTKVSSGRGNEIDRRARSARESNRSETRAIRRLEGSGISYRDQVTVNLNLERRRETCLDRYVVCLPARSPARLFDPPSFNKFSAEQNGFALAELSELIIYFIATAVGQIAPRSRNNDRSSNCRRGPKSRAHSRNITSVYFYGLYRDRSLIPG